jgi:hypothetical protein
MASPLATAHAGLNASTSELICAISVVVWFRISQKKRNTDTANKII